MSIDRRPINVKKEQSCYKNSHEVQWKRSLQELNVCNVADRRKDQINCGYVHTVTWHETGEAHVENENENTGGRGAHDPGISQGESSSTGAQLHPAQGRPI